MKHDSIAVVIPVYNGAADIERALASVFSQSHAPDEVIVVDDGSVDGTPQVLNAYRSRITYLAQANAGVATARNRGVALAQSEWVAFLDHDDEWLPRKLECQMAGLRESPHADLCYCAHFIRAVDGGCRVRYTHWQDVWPGVRLRNPFTPSTGIVRRSAIIQLGGFDESLPGATCEDWDFFIRFARRFPFVSIRTPLVNHYESVRSSSVDYTKALPNMLSILDKSLLVDLIGFPRFHWRRRIRSLMYYQAATSARQVGDTALSLVLRSIWEWPEPTFEARRFKTLLLELFR